MTAGLFAAVVVAWGFSWFAIKQQLGSVAPEISILWRFVAAAAVLWGGLAATGRLKRVAAAQHRWFAAMGLCLFSANFLLIYEASQYVASGVVSVVFTAATVFNAANRWVLLGQAPSPRILAGAALGMTGVGLLFGEALSGTSLAGGAMLGIALALAGTYVFSLGNLVSARLAGIDLPNAVARGMLWGVAFLALAALAAGSPVTIEPTARYLVSLAYLAVPGSVVGFLAYLSLIARVGAERAAYATVLFPVVALAMSTALEGYRWTPWAAAGLPLILLGNVMIFARLPIAAIARRT